VLKTSSWIVVYSSQPENGLDYKIPPEEWQGWEFRNRSFRELGRLPEAIEFLDRHLGQGLSGGPDRRFHQAKAGLEAAGRLPHPSYVLDAGTEMVPRDYFDLAEAAGGVEHLREMFLQRYRAAAGPGSTPAEEEWEAYLTGAYGVCLNRVSPETIVQVAPPSSLRQSEWSSTPMA